VDFAESPIRNSLLMFQLGVVASGPMKTSRQGAGVHGSSYAKARQPREVVMISVLGICDGFCDLSYVAS
jgi:hypothetical protein